MELFSLRAIHSVVIVFLALYLTDNVRADDMFFAEKRAASCQSRYSNLEPQHTACLKPSKLLTESGVSPADQKVIVDTHNEERRIVSPPATNMMAISWDDALANIAQHWADNCVFAHDKSYNRSDFGRFTVGQNLAMGQKSWKEAILAWASEKQDYDFDSISSKNGKPVGHYTQVVWAESVRVGCGFSLCGNDRIYVCNYGPGGNMRGIPPYKAGTSCGACSSSCKNKLCDCGSALCKNGGTMDPNTCSCTCKSEFYVGNDCTLNCDGGASEPFQCPSWKVHCKTVPNAPQDCPKTCGWCKDASNV